MSSNAPTWCGDAKQTARSQSLAAELLEQRSGHLAHGLTGERVLRQRGGERAHGAGIAVRGTMTVEPDSVIVQWASMVPGSGNSSSGRTNR